MSRKRYYTTRIRTYRGWCYAPTVTRCGDHRVHLCGALPQAHRGVLPRPVGIDRSFDVGG